MTEALTHERLLEALVYDCDTGLMISKSRGRKGRIAGCINGLGYRVIRIDKRLYAAHRLAWFYHHRCWPVGVIDHINGVKHDNRLANLRDVPKPHNHHNMKGPQRNSGTGLLGVSFSSRRQHFIAQITVEGKRMHLGSYPTAQLAHEAYLRAKRALHPGNTL